MIDNTFFKPKTDCLVLGVVTGEIDCKYWLADGLGADIAAVKPLNGKALRSAVREKAAEWSVEADMMPDDSQPYSHDFSEVRAPCVWVCLQPLHVHKHTPKHPNAQNVVSWVLKFGPASAASPANHPLYT